MASRKFCCIIQEVHIFHGLDFTKKKRKNPYILSVIHTNHISECNASALEQEVLFKSDGQEESLPKNLDRMSRAIFSAATALVSMVLAAFSKAFT
jgi:hypothetical protein